MLEIIKKDWNKHKTVSTLFAASLPDLFFPAIMAKNKETGKRTFGPDALHPDIRENESLSYPVRPSIKIDKVGRHWMLQSMITQYRLIYNSIFSLLTLYFQIIMIKVSLTCIIDSGFVRHLKSRLMAKYTGHRLDKSLLFNIGLFLELWKFWHFYSSPPFLTLEIVKSFTLTLLKLKLTTTFLKFWHLASVPYDIHTIMSCTTVSVDQSTDDSTWVFFCRYVF